MRLKCIGQNLWGQTRGSFGDVAALASNPQQACYYRGGWDGAVAMDPERAERCRSLRTVDFLPGAGSSTIELGFNLPA
jgi:hypothetical protein